MSRLGDGRFFRRRRRASRGERSEPRTHGRYREICERAPRGGGGRSTQGKAPAPRPRPGTVAACLFRLLHPGPGRGGRGLPASGVDGRSFGRRRRRREADRAERPRPTRRRTRRFRRACPFHRRPAGRRSTLGDLQGRPTRHLARDRQSATAIASAAVAARSGPEMTSCQRTAVESELRCSTWNIHDFAGFSSRCRERPLTSVKTAVVVGCRCTARWPLRRASGLTWLFFRSQLAEHPLGPLFSASARVQQLLQRADRPPVIRGVVRLREADPSPRAVR